MMQGGDGYALRCISILRMPFLRPKQTHTTTRLENLKDVTNGKISNLTNFDLHYCAGLPLMKSQFKGTFTFPLQIKNTTTGYSGKICIEIADEPFPSGFAYTDEFKSHLIKLNGQTTWTPYEMNNNTKTDITFNTERDKVYYLMWYEKGKTYGGQITYLVSGVNEKSLEEY